MTDNVEVTRIPSHPQGYFLISENNRADFSYRKCISELIDNSLDAKANTITISRLKKNDFMIVDDGMGCDDFKKLSQFGSHEDLGGIGLYGVGLKYAGVCLWGIQEFVSIKNNVMRKMIIDWDLMVTENFPDHDQLKIPVTDSVNSGMKITFRNIGRSNLNGNIRQRNIGILFGTNLDSDVINSLEFWYRPALINNKNIIFENSNQKRILKPYKEPLFCERFIFEDESINKKKFSVVGGIVAKGERIEHSGFAFCKSHRVITVNSDPVGEYSSNRIFAWVNLADDWHLSTNKELINDDDYDELVELIHQLCEPYLKQATEDMDDIVLKDFFNMMSDQMTKVIKAKETRKPPDPNKPKIIRIIPNIPGPERRRQHFKNTQADPFNTAIIRGINAIKVELANLASDKVFEVDTGKTARVKLNENDLRIKKHLKDRNFDALYNIAACAFASDACDKQTNLKILFKDIPPDRNWHVNFEAIVKKFTEAKN